MLNKLLIKWIVYHWTWKRYTICSFGHFKSIILFTLMWSKEIGEREKTCKSCYTLHRSQKVVWNRERGFFVCAGSQIIQANNSISKQCHVTQRDTFRTIPFTIEHFMSYNSFDNKAHIRQKIYPFFFFFFWSIISRK